MSGTEGQEPGGTDPIDLQLPRGATGSGRGQSTPQSTAPLTRLIDAKSLFQVTPYHGDRASFLGWKWSLLTAGRAISKPLYEGTTGKCFWQFIFYILFVTKLLSRNSSVYGTATGAVPVHIGTGTPVARDEDRIRGTIPIPTFASRPSTMNSLLPVDTPQNSMVGQQRQQIWEMQFDKFTIYNHFYVGR